jgi:putative transposase
MYYWRELTDAQRKDVIQYRQTQRYPRHSPPHFDLGGERRYLVTGACYVHAHIIGKSPDRMSDFESRLLAICSEHCSETYAWCLLPNHYHLLIKTAQISAIRQEIGKLHGRTAFEWNGEDEQRGRKVWFNCFERPMKSDRHYFASLNYVLNNSVHHGYAEKWQDWPWSNAAEYLESVGHERAAAIWNEYPILDYGAKWDKF